MNFAITSGKTIAVDWDVKHQLKQTKYICHAIKIYRKIVLVQKDLDGHLYGILLLFYYDLKTSNEIFLKHKKVRETRRISQSSKSRSVP